MKYSNYIGSLAAIALIAICFVPWVYIETIKTTVTGLNSGKTNFGSPGIIHIFFAVITIAFFLIHKIWAKRTNLFACTLNFAWAIRNFIILTRCEFGDCPEKKAGIYAALVFSILMLIMSMLPKINVPVQRD